MPLSQNELVNIRDLLTGARAAALWVSDVYHLTGNIGAAARLNDIANRLAAEIDDIDRLLAKPKP